MKRQRERESSNERRKIWTGDAVGQGETNNEERGKTEQGREQKEKEERDGEREEEQKHMVKLNKREEDWVGKQSEYCTVDVDERENKK